MTASWHDRWHQRVFDRLASRSLLYNACWEDPALDRVALRLGPQDDVLMIASAGCNALDYALCGPRRIVAVDANPLQAALLELKIAAIRRLDDEDVMALFGHGRHRYARELYQVWLRSELTPAARAVWDERIGWFSGRWGDGFYWHGLSGLVARLMRGYVLCRPGLRRALDRLLASRDLAEQQAVYDRELAPRLWGPFLTWLASRQTIMSLLGVPPAQTREVAAHQGGTRPVAGFIRACIERVLRELPVATNYFWACALQGRYAPGNCPEYLRPHNLAILRSGMIDRIEVRTATVAQAAAADGAGFSRYVLLDHLDWLGERDDGQVAGEWSALFAAARPQARAIFRSASAQPAWLARARLPGPGGGTPLRERLRFDRELAAQLHARDRVGTYGGFHIADLER